MIQLDINNNSSLIALKRVILNLLHKDDLTSRNIDKLCLLGTERGYSQEYVWDIILDCQIERSIN